MVDFFVKIVYWANNSGRGARVEADNERSFIIDFMKTNTKNFEKLVQTFSIKISFLSPFLPAFKVVHWLVPNRLLVTRAAGRREQRVMGREKGGRRPFSLAFLIPITPLAPLRRARERRLGTSQGCAYNLKWAFASRSLNTGLWVLLRVFTIHTRLAYKSSSNSFTSAKRKR